LGGRGGACETNYGERKKEPEGLDRLVSELFRLLEIPLMKRKTGIRDPGKGVSASAIGGKEKRKKKKRWKLTQKKRGASHGVQGKIEKSVKECGVKFEKEMKR